MDTNKEKIDVGQLDKLVTWNQIEGLENVSGIGEYTAVFKTNDEYEKVKKHIFI